MGKLVKLNETDLVKIIKRVITETKNEGQNKKLIFEQTSEQQNIINRLVNNDSKKAKEYFLNHFSKPETIKKFKYKSNVEKIKKFISTIRYRTYYKKDGKYAYVQKLYSDLINLNIYYIFNIKGNNITVKENVLYDTIVHEMSHLIDFKLQRLWEDTIESSAANYRPSGDYDDYVESDTETYARIQRLREVLNLSPNDNAIQIRDKILEFINAKKLIFPNIQTYLKKSDNNLAFAYKDKPKGKLSQLWQFYDTMTINGSHHNDISALFAKFSKLAKSGEKDLVLLDLETLGRIHISTVDNSTSDSPSNLA